MVLYIASSFFLFLIFHAHAAPQPNEIVIELNEKLAKLQLTVSKQAERIKQLEQEKAELESKCQGKAKVAVGTPSNYNNPLWENSTESTTQRAPPTTQPPTLLKTGKQLKSNSWQKVASLDCYAGRGGDPIQPDPYSNHMSLNDCKAACNADYNCQGVIRKSSDGQGSGVCYKRRNIVTNNCVRDPVWDLHRKPSGGSSSASSRPPSSAYGCKYGVQGYPRNLPNSHFYTRLCTTNNNLKIVSSSRPTNAALERTAYLIGNVMANVDPRVAQSMNARGFRHAVMAAYPQEVTTHIPEHAWLGAYWNERARGPGATGIYAMTDFKEYFAEGVQSYFDTNAPDNYAPITRDQLWRKDPNLYHFLNRYLGNNPWKRTC